MTVLRDVFYSRVLSQLEEETGYETRKTSDPSRDSDTSSFKMADGVDDLGYFGER